MDSTGVYAVAALKSRVNVRSGRPARRVIAATGFLAWKLPAIELVTAQKIQPIRECTSSDVI
jgi:hypothetical protein